MKLCLGTVQFGMDYGISGQKQPSLEDSIKMLDFAVHNGIDTIDTAFAYGTAEDVVGEFIKRKLISRDKFFLCSKLKPNSLDDVKPENLKKEINSRLEDSMKRLNTDYLDAYMLHSSRYVFNDEILDALYEVKKEGKIRHCGVSVYYPDEAKAVLNNEKMDFMQLPFSIFDQRMAADGVFELAKKLKNTTIHSRSAFIQGLILMNPNQVPEFLKDAIPIVEKIETLCKKYNISRIELAMLYVKHFAEISHLVFGVDNIEQLKENIKIFENDFSSDIIEEIAKEFKNIDTNIVMPSLWVKK